MTLRPMPFHWDGEIMRPSPKFAELARRQFKAGSSYVLEPHDPISLKERGFYFASVKAAWDNLSPEAVVRYPSADHLRRWALVKAGWRKDNYTVCETPEHAAALAGFIRRLDDFAVVVVQGNVVRTYVARTQKVGSRDLGLMTPEEFRQSKQDVLDILSGEIGVSRKALEREGRA